MKSAFVLTNDVPSKQLLPQLQAQVQWLWTLCMAMGRGLIVPRAHAAVVSREPSCANALMPAQTVLRRARTQSHGRGRYFRVYSTGADVCAAGADVNDSCSENSEWAWMECERARAECKRAQAEYKRVRTVL
jgi:hypothetical protein